MLLHLTWIKLRKAQSESLSFLINATMRVVLEVRTGILLAMVHKIQLGQFHVSNRRDHSIIQVQALTAKLVHICR